MKVDENAFVFTCSLALLIQSLQTRNQWKLKRELGSAI